MDSQKINRLRLQDFLTFEVRQGRNIKLEVYRNGLEDKVPHLTISFGNFSGEIDIHLTTRIKGKSEPIYKSVAKISESEIGKVFSLAEETLRRIAIQNIEKVKKVRPGWLGRKGYAIFYLDENAESEFIDKIAPKRSHKGKRERFLNSIMFDEFVNSSDLTSCIYHPSILHELATINYKNPVTAFRICGKHKPITLPIGFLKISQEKHCWIRLDKFTDGIKDSLQSYLFSCFKQLLPENIWTIIQSEMYLEELGIK